VSFDEARGEARQALHVANADGSGARIVATDVGSPNHFSWNPDGSRIYYTTIARVGTSQIRTVSPDGSVRGVLAMPASLTNGIQHHPAISPDGQWIAFVTLAGDPARRQLHVMRLDGTGLVKLTNAADNVSAPSWSPDGQWIAYEVVASSGDTKQLYKIRRDGAQVTKLTPDGFTGDGHPGWR
jgi:TolB protein